MPSSSRANRYQPYPWTGSPDQVSGAASHVAPPPVTSRSRTSATQTGYPTDEIYPSAHGTSFQNPGHSTLHPFYDPHPDQFSAALENAFPYLHTPQNGSTSFIAGSTTQGLALANPSSHFPHSSYSELVNYAGKYRPAGNASGAAPSTGMGHAAPLASYTERNLTSNRRASVAEPFAKSQKRKSRKSATDVSASAAAKDELGNESREELARKKKKADQQRGYREMDKGAIKELEDILPDGYKVYESRRNRKTITRGIECIRDLLEENRVLKMKLSDTKVALQQALEIYHGAVKGHDAMAHEVTLLRCKESKMLTDISELQNIIESLQSGK